MIIFVGNDNKIQNHKEIKGLDSVKYRIQSLISAFLSIFYCVLCN